MRAAPGILYHRRWWSLLQTLIILALVSVSAVDANSASFSLFDSNTLACFRIPSVASDGKATILVAAEQRFSSRPVGYEQFKTELATGTAQRNVPIRCSDAGYINIVLRRSTDGGNTWAPMQLLVDFRQFLGKDYRVALAGNPTLTWVPASEKFVLLFAVSRSQGDNSARCIFGKEADQGRCDGPVDHGLWMTVSSDRGETWSVPQPISLAETDQQPILERPGPGHGIVLSSGRIVVGAYPHLLLSDDAGKTWRYGATAPRGETSVVSLNDGTLWAMLRPPPAVVRDLTEEKGRLAWRLSAYSEDGGETYQRIVPDDRFPVPEVQAALLRAKRGSDSSANVVATFPSPRHISVPRDIQADRRRLLVVVADGMGQQLRARFIDEGPVGYSDLVQLDANTIAAVYEGTTEPSSDANAHSYDNVLWKTVDLNSFSPCSEASGCFSLSDPLPSQFYDANGTATGE